MSLAMDIWLNFVAQAFHQLHEFINLIEENAKISLLVSF